jgi:hypothetical protein
MSVLYVKNNGVWEPITTIKGDPGEVTQEEFGQLSDEVSEIEANKADTDLSNLSEEGEDKLKQLSFPYVGQTIFSLDPLIEDTLHLLDGTLLPVGGIYDQFITEYVANLYTTYPQRFCTETEWQNSVNTYGVCGKYVYNAGVSVRLPKVTGFVEGTIDPSVLGEITEAGLPTLTTNSTGAHTHTRGTMNITAGGLGGGHSSTNPMNNVTGAFTRSTNNVNLNHGSGTADYGLIGFDASKSWTGATSSAGAHTHTIAGTSNTVQPQSIKGFIYIVVATGSKTDIEVDLDKYTTDLNSKMDKDYSNATYQPVNKSGDTMTGSLVFPNANNSPMYFNFSSLTDSTATPSANSYYGIQFNDAKGVRVGKIEASWKTDGTTTFGINAHRTVNGTAKYCQLTCSVDASGNLITSAPTPATTDNSTKIATTAYCVNRRCTTKPATTSTASITRPCWVVQNYLNGTSWYRVWSDGFIEQGGKGSGSTTISLLKSYSNTNYTLLGSATENRGVFRASAKTTSGFTTSLAMDASGTWDWVAYGY